MLPKIGDVYIVEKRPPNLAKFTSVKVSRVPTAAFSHRSIRLRSTLVTPRRPTIQDRTQTLLRQRHLLNFFDTSSDIVILSLRYSPTTQCFRCTLIGVWTLPPPRPYGRSPYRTRDTSPVVRQKIISD